MVYPGTEAYELAQKNGSLRTMDFHEWLTPDGLHSTVINQPGLTADDLVAWCDQARRSFYLTSRLYPVQSMANARTSKRSGSNNQISPNLLQTFTTLNNLVDQSPRISIIIPTRNGEATIGKCLEALIHQTAAQDLYEIIVVDDGSRDGTCDQVEEYGKVRLFKQENCGPSFCQESRAESSPG